MKKFLDIVLLSVVLGFALLIAASLRVMCDEISDKGIKKVALELWHGRGYSGE